MTETVDRLEASFGQVTMAAPVARPVLAGAREPQAAAFEGFLRSGASVEMKAFTGVSGDSGGYAVPQEIDAVIDATLKSISPIRAIANVVKVGSAGYRKLVTTGGTPSGWAGETGDRDETDTPSFAEIAPPMGELYANPSASQAMLDDALFDVEQWLAGEMAVSVRQTGLYGDSPAATLIIPPIGGAADEWRQERAPGTAVSGGGPGAEGNDRQ